MDDDEKFAFDLTERNEPFFAIVLAIVRAGENGAFEDQRGIEQVDATLPDDLLPFSLIPFELQAAFPGKPIS